MIRRGKNILFLSGFVKALSWSEVLYEHSIAPRIRADFQDVVQTPENWQDNPHGQADPDVGSEEVA